MPHTCEDSLSLKRTHSLTHTRTHAHTHTHTAVPPSAPTHHATNKKVTSHVCTRRMSHVTHDAPAAHDTHTHTHTHTHAHTHTHTHAHTHTCDKNNSSTLEFPALSTSL